MLRTASNFSTFLKRTLPRRLGRAQLSRTASMGVRREASRAGPHAASSSVARTHAAASSTCCGRTNSVSGRAFSCVQLFKTEKTTAKPAAEATTPNGMLHPARISASIHTLCRSWRRVAPRLAIWPSMRVRCDNDRRNMLRSKIARPKIRDPNTRRESSRTCCARSDRWEKDAANDSPPNRTAPIRPVQITAQIQVNQVRAPPRTNCREVSRNMAFTDGSPHLSRFGRPSGAKYAAREGPAFRHE